MPPQHKKGKIQFQMMHLAEYVRNHITESNPLDQ